MPETFRKKPPPLNHALPDRKCSLVIKWRVAVALASAWLWWLGFGRVNASAPVIRVKKAKRMSTTRPGTGNPGLDEADYEKLQDMASSGIRRYARTGGGRPDDATDLAVDLPLPRRTQGDQDISVRQCEDWRRRNEEGESFETIAETDGVSLSTVSRHVNDECSHERAATVDAQRCGVIRCMAADGHSFAYIARTFDFGARQTISEHGLGRCTHEIDVPPVEPRQGPNGTAAEGGAD